MKKIYKFKAFEDALYSIQFWLDGEGILCCTETSNLTKDGLDSYNPLPKTLYHTAEDQIQGLARALAYSQLLDNKDKRLLVTFFKEYIRVLKRDGVLSHPKEKEEVGGE